MIKYFIFQNNTTIFFITSNILINNLFNPINNNTSIYIYNIIINNIYMNKLGINDSRIKFIKAAINMNLQ